jgi:DNA-binding transcriptional ArsR family regulator
MAEPVIVLEPGEERAQKIAKAMASQTAGDILRFIGDGQKTSTEISEALSLPMNTAKYHIENLLEAGLISVAATKYSVKGREVKVYTLTNQLLIVAPRPSNVRSILLKYASLFAIVVLATLAISVLSPLFMFQNPAPAPVAYDGTPRMAAQEAGGAVSKSAADTFAYNYSGQAEAMAPATNAALGMAPPNASQAHDAIASVTQATVTGPAATTAPVPVPLDTALAFLLGGCFIIIVLVCYEVYIWRKSKGR